jgi:hypothetical protein
MVELPAVAAPDAAFADGETEEAGE